jgi:putative transposase
MTRQARIVVPGAVHHVTQRGNASREIFASHEDRMEYLALAKIHADRGGVRIAGWCLMGNHIHFAAIPEAPLSLARMFGPFHSSYSRRYQSHRRTKGHLFEARFYSAAIDDDAALEVVRYIELNPVRAGLVPRAQDYLYSSARGRVFGVEDPLVDRAWAPALEIGDWSAWLHEMVADHVGDFRAHLIRAHTLRGDSSVTVT